MTNWEKFPKLELHLHLEGGAPPEFIRALAGEKNIDVSSAFGPDGSYVYKDFIDFLRVYEVACEVLKTPDDFARLTEAVLAKSAENGVIYTELFVSPDFCGGCDRGAWADYFAAMCEGAARSKEKHGIEARFIVTCVRHFGAEQAVKAAQCATDQMGEMLVGFGMGGDEGFGATKDFQPAFQLAGNAGLALTTHAGEWGGPSSVWDSLKYLNVTRIGHGVRSIEDPALVEHLALHNIVLEVSPGSNIALNVYPNLSAHPIQKLMSAGVPVTVSTDDPPYFHTDMTQEFANLADEFKWGREEFMTLNETSLSAVFASDALKKRLNDKLSQLMREI